jgi:hypothetical protein
LSNVSTKNIAFIGAHCSGKTTRAYELAVILSTLGCDVILVDEGAKKCPYGINEKGTIKSQRWMFARFTNCIEKALSKKPDFIVSDRTVLDIIPYTKYLTYEVKRISITEGEDLMNRCLAYWINILSDQTLFFCTPLPLVDNGIRSVNGTYRKYVHDEYLKTLKSNHIPFTVIGEREK